MRGSPKEGSADTMKNLIFNGKVWTLLSGQRGPLNSLGFCRKIAVVNTGDEAEG